MMMIFVHSSGQPRMKMIACDSIVQHRRQVKRVLGAESGLPRLSDADVVIYFHDKVFETVAKTPPAHVRKEHRLKRSLSSQPRIEIRHDPCG
jgi:hypothetical protein